MDPIVRQEEDEKVTKVQNRENKHKNTYEQRICGTEIQKITPQIINRINE